MEGVDGALPPAFYLIEGLIRAWGRVRNGCAAPRTNQQKPDLTPDPDLGITGLPAAATCRGAAVSNPCLRELRVGPDGHLATELVAAYGAAGPDPPSM